MLILLDFETYYDKDFSLSKMPYEEYIRDPRFNVIMVSMLIDDVEHTIVGDEEVRKFLHTIPWNEATVVAHNARFDAMILTEYFKVPPVFKVLCTMLMARVLNISMVSRTSLDALSRLFISRGVEVPIKGGVVHNMIGKQLSDMTEKELTEYVEYCKGDTAILKVLYDYMRPLVPNELLAVMNMTIHMSINARIELDLPLLERGLEQYLDDRNKYLENFASDLSMTPSTALSMLRSKPRFAKKFKSYTGTDLPLKPSAKKTDTLNAKVAAKMEADEDFTALVDSPLIKQEKGKYVVYDYCASKDDLEFIALLKSPVKRVVQMVNARLEYNSSIKESRLRRFIGIASRGKLPFSLEYFSAHTGRYGGADKTNLQNLPARGGDLLLRHSLKAGDGKVFVVCDSSQVEARVLAWIANEKYLIDLFASGGDPYSAMASDIYTESYESISQGNKDHDSPNHKDAKFKRSVGKQAVLGCGYQMSGNAFADYVEGNGIILSPEIEEVAKFGDQATAEGITDPVAREIFVHSRVMEYHKAESNRIVNVYRGKNANIRAFWYECQGVLASLVRGDKGYFGGPDGKMFYYDGTRQVMGYNCPGIMLPNGYWITYPNLRSKSDPDNERSGFAYTRMSNGVLMEYWIYGGKVAENITQGLAFAILLWQGVRIATRYPIVLNVHDEWGCIVDESEAEQAQAFIEAVMSARPPYMGECPITCESSIGTNYGECK